MQQQDTVPTSSAVAEQAPSDKAAFADAGTDCYREVVSSARRAPSINAYFSSVLRAVVGALGSPYAAIYVRLPSEVIQDDAHSGSTDPDFWRPKVQGFLTESLTQRGTRARVLKARQSGEKIAFIAAPVFDSADMQIGAIALVLAPFDEENVVTRLSWLESVMRLASFAAGFHGTAGGQAKGPAAEAPNQALARAANYTTAEELAFSITNSLRNKLACEQVGLGLVVRRRVKILSISGLDHVAKQGDGVTCLQAAMEECYDARWTLACQPHSTWTSDDVGFGYGLHKQWSAAARGDAVVSIPLEGNGEVAAVLSLRRRPDEPWTGEQIEQVRSRVEPFAAALVLSRRASRGLLQHVADNAHSAKRALLGPGRRGTKIAAAVAVIAAGWFAFGSKDYVLTVPCSVAPAQVRHVTVPFDGVLFAAAALEGDRVKAGDVLCQMDDRELEQQRGGLLAEIAVLEHEKDRAMAADKPVDVQLALASQKLAQARLDMVNTRIEQATIRSPIDGVVVSGDLRKRIGAVATRGGPLFEVAPLEQWILELYVPEADADDLDAGLGGGFVPHARPEESQAFQITRVRPQSEIHGQKNVYVAEADTDLPYTWMRPGMEGVAKIDVGRRRVWWVALHRAIEYVQFNVWP
jgi:hypothetical protein